MEATFSVSALQAHIQNQRWHEALDLLAVGCRQQPENRQWPLLAASLQFKVGNVTHGVRELEQLTRRWPDYMEAWVNLGQGLKALGQFDQALSAYQQALSLSPGQVLALKSAAECAEKLDAPNKAMPFLKALANIGAADLQVWRSLARCQLESAPAEAIESAKQALALAPGDPELSELLARAYVNNESFELALPLFEVVANDARFRLAGLKGLIACELYLGHCEQALERVGSYREAGGAETEALLLVAKGLVQLGDKAGAVDAYRQALVLDPRCVDAWYGLLIADPAAVSEDEKAQLEAHWPTMLAGRDKMLAAFALARWYEQVQNFPQQLTWLDRANAERRQQRPFDANLMPAWKRVVSDICDRAWFDRVALSSPEERCPRPILICGMPRSGTTLVEQIIGMHSLVTSRGENQAHAQALHCLGEKKGSQQLDKFLGGVKSEDLEYFRSRYADLLINNEGVSTECFTSKSMDLAFNLGVFLAAFPELRVVQMRRHPLDVGLGCYKQYFAQGQAFSGSWAGIAQFYSVFESLMDHWKSLFPSQIMELPYEVLVADQEGVTRKLAQHCGLEWQPGLLDFCQSKAVVTTASAIQVRRGLFADAVDRWQGYGALLDPLKAELEQQHVDWQSYSADIR